MGYPDPTLYAIPLFIGLLVLEPTLLARLARRGRALRGYEPRDRNASLGMGLGSLLFASVVNLLTFEAAAWLWPHRLCDLGSGVLGWTVAILAVDVSYYWNHRVEHESRLLWACHVNHHSSRYYNFSTALRQPWTPWTGVVFYPCWALAGVAPSMIMMSYGLNLIYQFWVHTEVVGRMPRWFEAVFNTPSHHRVHHGSNPEYLDKNYAGILIVWDRLFGTFEPERAPVLYGLTKNIESFNLWTIAFHEYAAIARDLACARGLRDRLGVLWHGPAWRAPSLRPWRSL
jgi:sterol desaturase/sphingolipid hydroxylase (fatty acid hydroxylase superfamily)